VPSLISWIAMTLAGVWAGRSGQTQGAPATGTISVSKEWLAAVGPYVFVVGLLLLVGWAAEALFTNASQLGWAGVALLFASVLAVTLVFAWRVDINEFSMHAFYRNRLARGYLGASNLSRKANPFTGIDPEDSNVPVSGLRASAGYPGPFPIFCAALNISDGDELAWQERKAASFVFTPICTGYDTPWTSRATSRGCARFSGYVDTDCFAYPPKGIHIATVAAISGAALSPNWGYHTNPVTAFLLTLFNARLGWWLLNPRSVAEDGLSLPHTAKNRRQLPPSPKIAVFQMIRELLGITSDVDRYVYLSDGGHFDNMGLYELVRRRCRFIIVSDAEQDGEAKFEGISMAIRRCRADFRVEIDLDLRMLEPNNEKISSRHVVVGTIKYPDIDEKGTIVYLKSSLTGDEPADVLGYRKSDTAFPHDTTVNQWFTESLFESYRRLGLHVFESTFEPAMRGVVWSTDCARQQLFDNLRVTWTPPTPEMEKFHQVHSDRYDALIREMRQEPRLAGLLDSFYGDGDRWKDNRSPEQIAYALGFISELIEFMSNVYIDLKLVFPANVDHPYAQTWIKLFHKCGKVDIVQDGWQKFGPSYTPRFQRFAVEDVGLPRLTAPGPAIN
ncbi:MAG: hypothetical protein C5B57_13555, partial [Blastocatellia bacterium]